MTRHNENRGVTEIQLDDITLSKEEIEKMVASLFEPDTVLCAQYLETVCRKNHLLAEQKLMLAVLEDAVSCFQKYFAARDKIGTSLFREAEEWILLQGKSNWFFAFDYICETLNLNPDYIRKGLLHWRYHRLSERDRVRLRVNESRYASRN